MSYDFEDDYDYSQDHDCDIRSDERFEGLSINEIEALLEDEALSKELAREAVSSWYY